MRRLRFQLRSGMNSYDEAAALTISMQVECEPNNECFHDHFYLSEDMLKQIPAAAAKFNVERTHNSGSQEVSDGSNTRH